MKSSRRIGAVSAAVALILATGSAALASGNRPASPSSASGATRNGVVLPDGRLVTPVGRTTSVGVFPLGVAVSPDGSLVATINSGQGFGLNTGFNSYCGQGQNNGAPPPCPYMTQAQRSHVGDPAEPAADESISVVDTKRGSVSEIKAVPSATDPAHAGRPGTFNFFYVGISFSPDGRHLYAAGGGNNALYDFPVRDGAVAPKPARTLVLPDRFATAGGAGPSYPIYGPNAGFTKGLAVTGDGAHVLVTHEFNNTLDVVDTASWSYNQIPLEPDPAPVGGFYPYGVAVTRDGSTAYVAGQGLGEVAVVRLSGGNGNVVGMIPVGDHPTAVALSPDATQAYVTNADDDTLSIIDTATRTVASSLSLHAVPGEQYGSTPNAVAVSPDGRRIYVALAGDNALAVIDGGTAIGGLPVPTAWRVAGLLPTGWYPAAVATAPGGARLYVASAKGLGSRTPATGQRDAHEGGNGDGALTDQYQYDGNNMPGLLQSIPAPSAHDLAAGTRRVQANTGFAAAGHDRSPHNPVPARPGDPSPITHVIEIVRENRTFDQVLGDLGPDEGRNREGVNGEPAYVTFGRDVTPNAHAFAGDPTTKARTGREPAFATADNFFSNGEASVQGHWWTAAANVTDYVEKSWPQYYSPRNHVYDPESTVSQPHNCTIFQSALTKQVATGGQFTVRNYGELIGLSNVSVQGVQPGSPAGPLPIPGFHGPTEVPDPCVALPNGSVDPQAIGDENLDVDNRSTATEFLDDIGLNPDGSPNAKPGNTLRNFSYLTLAGDHTGGLSFAETPRSRVAENDAGLGMIVSAISHSSYWSSTAILVMEDDSQDGLDHVDGHRNLLFVISPYAKHTGADGKPGYITHLHLSQASVVKTVELISGLPFLSTHDQYAPALYDLFQDKNRADQLTADDMRAYDTQPLPAFAPEPSSCYTSPTPPPSCHTTAMSQQQRADLDARSRSLDLRRIDAASPDLEIIAWELAHPGRAVPPSLLNEMRAWQLRQAQLQAHPGSPSPSTPAGRDDG